MLDLVLNFCSTYLIEVMAGILTLGLVFRWKSFGQSKKTDAYYKTFTSEVEKFLSENKIDKADHSAEEWVGLVLDGVKSKLPSKSLRNSSRHRKSDNKLKSKNIVSLREYVGGESSLFNALRDEAKTFEGQYPPNFGELTNRILERDDSFNKLFNFFPAAPISRLIDTLPGIFVVLGIFGTFIGISMALPEIATIDFTNIDASGDILKNFVLAVTYAMKTSIAGILFSLLMTFLNTVAPTRGTRNKTVKTLTNCMEHLWINYKGKSNLEDIVSTKLDAILDNMSKKIETKAS